MKSLRRLDTHDEGKVAWYSIIYYVFCQHRRRWPLRLLLRFKRLLKSNVHLVVVVASKVSTPFWVGWRLQLALWFRCYWWARCSSSTESWTHFCCSFHPTPTKVSPGGMPISSPLSLSDQQSICAAHTRTTTSYSFGFCWLLFRFAAAKLLLLLLLLRGEPSAADEEDGEQLCCSIRGASWWGTSAGGTCGPSPVAADWCSNSNWNWGWDRWHRRTLAAGKVTDWAEESAAAPSASRRPFRQADNRPGKASRAPMDAAGWATPPTGWTKANCSVRLCLPPTTTTSCWLLQINSIQLNNKIITIGRIGRSIVFVNLPLMRASGSVILLLMCWWWWSQCGGHGRLARFPKLAPNWPKWVKLDRLK